MVGRLFNNRYQLIDRIGIGGMAEVYRAQDNVLGRIVAVKTMLPQYAADSTFTQRFKQEAAAAANLQSPYIVNVYDWGQDEGTYYLVMEYIRGSDLKTAINERGAINQRKVAEIGTQVCQALSAAHNLDIIHRDIKPQNIMVQPDGNVKVMDFGIARAKNSVKSKTSSVLGTAHYISPEQAQGKELTAASDIYSLGIVLYEAVAGQLPFDGPDAISVAMKQVNETPFPLHKINPDIDPALESIIFKALAKNPYERFATANDMKFALTDYLSGRPVFFGNTFSGSETAVIGGLAGAGFAGAALAGAGHSSGTAVMPAVGGGGPINPVGTNYMSSGGKNDKDDNKNSKKKVGIIIAIIAALLIIAGVAFALNGGFGSGDAIPDVTGQTTEVAKTKLEAAGFSLGTTTEAYSSSVAAGKIISQDPSSGTKRDKGTKVNVVVSKGTEQVTVPDITNMTADQAKQALDKVGLKASAGTAEYSSTVELNKIIKQTPASGQTANKGDTITYILSLGTENIDVPNVVGSSESSATSTLQSAGFTVSKQQDYSETVSKGVVISQNPSGKAAKGSAVTITVSLGKDPSSHVTVPYLIDNTVSSATTKLQAAGLTWTFSGSSDPNAIVKGQTPSSGQSVATGTNIVLTTQAP